MNPNQEGEKPKQPQFSRRRLLGTAVKAIPGAIVVGSIGGCGAEVTGKTNKPAQPVTQPAKLPTDKNLQLNVDQVPTVGINPDKPRPVSTAQKIPDQVEEQILTPTPAADNLILSQPTPDREKEIRLQTEQNPLNSILSLPLQSKERINLEKSLVEKVVSLSEIDRAFLVVTDPKLRSTLLSKRFEYRQKHPQETVQIPKKVLEWALKEEIHPEVLAICLEAYPKANSIIKELFEGDRQAFRPDLFYKEKIGDLPKSTCNSLKADALMMNVGGMARLICTETGIGDRFNYQGNSFLVSYGFANIGQKSALSQIQTDPKKGFAAAPAALRNICRKISQKTGLFFNPDNIPGSSVASGNVSGGAISVGMMPNTIEDTEELICPDKDQNLDKYLNPFDLKDAVALTWVILAKGYRITEGEYRFGYLKGANLTGENIRKAALGKWNRWEEQINKILNSANSYFESIIKSGLLAY